MNKENRPTYKGYIFSPALDIDDTGKFLNSVEKDVSLLDSRLVLIILGIRAVGLHNTTDFVDSTVQAAKSLIRI